MHASGSHAGESCAATTTPRARIYGYAGASRLFSSVSATPAAGQYQGTPAGSYPRESEISNESIQTLSDSDGSWLIRRQRTKNRSGATNQNSQNSKASERLALSAEIDDPGNGQPLRISDGIFLKLRLKNISSNTVHLDDSRPAYDYDIEVMDAAGHEPPRTDWGERLIRGQYAVLRSIFMDIAPGHAGDVRVEITEVFKLFPGTFTVRVVGKGVRTEKPKDEKTVFERAFSNLVTFTCLN